MSNHEQIMQAAEKFQVANDNVLSTYGDWQDEQQSALAFDSVMEKCKLFKVYREVSGFYVQPRLEQNTSQPRIDRILVPNSTLIGSGWNQGIIGVELKRSQIKAGPALSQLVDYNRSLWKLPCGGFYIWLSWIFLWPLHMAYGTAASFMAQNRLGSCQSAPWALLIFHSGGNLILEISHANEIRLGNPTNGKRCGHR